MTGTGRVACKRRVSGRSQVSRRDADKQAQTPKDSSVL